MSDVILTVGLCAYGEAENLRTLLPQMLIAAALLTEAFEVLVIDAQTAVDDTAAVCEAMGVRCVPRRSGEAYGDAVRTMIAEARGEFLLNMDADGSHRAEDMRALWDARKAHDIVIGSRYVDGAASNNAAHLRWMSWALSKAFRWATRLPVRDFSNSLRLYRHSRITGLMLHAADFNVLQELLVEAVKACPRMSVGEVPVLFMQRRSGLSKRRTARFLWSYASTLWQLRSLARASPNLRARARGSTQEH